MTDLPPPLTPADCNLQNFPFMPLDVVRLRDSDLAAKATGDDFRCAVLLWCVSWHQVPAASLPDDDVSLAQYAGFGRVVKEWLKVRAGVLHGWIKCSDGRLYHPVVAEKANEAWAGRVKYRERKESDRQRKAEERRLKKEQEEAAALALRPKDNTTLSVGQSENFHGHPQENALIGTVDSGQWTVDSGQWTVDSGQLTTKPEAGDDSTGSGRAPPEADPPRTAPLPPPESPPANANPAVTLTVALRKLGVSATATHPTVIAWSEESVPVELLEQAVAIARESKPHPQRIPPNYLVGILHDLRNPPAKADAKPQRAADADWFRSRPGIERKARELGMVARGTESYDDLKDRIFARLREQQGAKP